jgi:hypothetical protein
MEGEVEDSQGYCLYQTEMLPERICCPVAPLKAFVFVLTLCQISFGTKDRFLLIPLAMTSHFLCWAQYLTKSVASGLPVYKDCELITIKSVAVLLYLPLIKSMITL